MLPKQGMRLDHRKSANKNKHTNTGVDWWAIPNGFKPLV